MKALVYSIIAGSIYEELSNQLHPDGVVKVLAPVNRSENRPARANRVPDWTGYDVVVCIEADIQIPEGLEFSTECIEIEKGTSEVAKKIPEEPYPYTGCAFVSVPVQFAEEFYRAWRVAYMDFQKHRCDERVLREALENSELPWRFREDNTFWPDKSGNIVHYQGVAAKRDIIPNFTQLLIADRNMAPITNHKAKL